MLWKKIILLHPMSRLQQHFSHTALAQCSHGRAVPYRAVRRLSEVDNTHAFLAHDEWPPNSPDCNPLDFHVWNSLREKVYAGRREPFENLQELEAAAKAAWREISVEEIRRAVDQFLPRLHVVVDQDGGPIQHLMG